MHTRRSIRNQAPVIALSLAFVMILSASCALSAQSEQTYDVVILNGRVMDPESGLDAVRNVGIQGGKVAAISTGLLSGKSIIDATGLVVSPGFIDLHCHGQDAENYRIKAMDGVTTALEMEVGVWPVRAWYATRQGKALINYGASVGHIPARIHEMHDSGTFLPRDKAVTEIATPAQQAAILADLDEGMQQGALGLGMGLAYTPTTSPEEALNVFKVAAKWRRPVFVHVRTPGGLTPGIVDSLQEMISDAAITGASVHIAHINSITLASILPHHSLRINMPRHKPLK